MGILKGIFGHKNPHPTEPIFPGESFSILKLTFPEGWGLASVNKAYDNYPNKLFYPWHVLVELEIIEKNENGHPIGSDVDKLIKIEEEIGKLLKQVQTVHFVTRVTRNGFRDLLYYIDKPNVTQGDINSFCGEIMREREINFSIQKDPTWKAVGFLE